jgi:hypothetical protein
MVAVAFQGKVWSRNGDYFLKITLLMDGTSSGPDVWIHSLRLAADISGHSGVLAGWVDL